jgi:hypothetical protein
VKKILAWVLHPERECQRNQQCNKRFDYAFKWILNNKRAFDLKAYFSPFTYRDTSIFGALVEFITRIIFDSLIIVTVVIGWILLLRLLSVLMARFHINVF